jgi:tyrosinase
MTDHDFVGVYSGGSRGFGGPKTKPLFAHAGSDHGGIETQPHDQVHGMVGGRDPIKATFKGLMSDPRLAGLDPIFWLHHANIDRLWEVWLRNPPTNINPTDPAWVAGPASGGEQKFSMPMPDGSSWDYTPKEIQDLGTLGYAYDDLSPAVPAVPPTARIQRLGASAEQVEAVAQKGSATVASRTNVELVGTNAEPLRIEGLGASTSVRLDSTMSRKVASSFAMNVAVPTPDRVFLNLENVRGIDDSAILQVYVDLPEGALPADHPELRAGSLALFGLEQASLPDGPHAGQGLNLALEITKIVDMLQVNDRLNANALDIRIVPRNPVPEDAQISIGRVSIFREGK